VGASAVELVATVFMIRIAAGIYERAVLRIGAPISLRSALRTSSATPLRSRLHVPARAVQGAAVGALLGGLIAGTDRPLGIALIAVGLALTAISRHGHRASRPPAQRNGPRPRA
jgi:hypothetical protein